MRGGLARIVVIAQIGAAGACGSSGTGAAPVVETAPDVGAADTGVLPDIDAALPDAATDAAVLAVDSLPANRDRLLTTYLAYLKATPGKQSNGLDGSPLTGVCDLWRTLVPSAQGVYLTLTARLQGSKLSADASSMLSHATKLYRVAGGDGATKSDHGSCGGDGNRMFVSIDEVLHTALVVTNTTKGMSDGGAPVLADIPVGAASAWHDSQDLAGPHAPFDRSDETVNGGPRGQVQFFTSTTSAAALKPLGRTDVMALIDPYALEVDQDYDCAHNSNPLCDYIFYGPLCGLAPSKSGTDIYTAKYGSIDPTWQPVDCAAK